MFGKLMSAVKFFTEDGLALDIANTSPLSTSQQWVLATGALLNAKEGHCLNTMHTGTHNDLMKEGLSSSWGVSNRDELLGLARHLSSLPNQAEYEALWGEMRQFLSPQGNKSASGVGKMIGGLTQFIGVTNPLQMTSAMKALQGKTSDNDQDLAEKLNNSMQWLTELDSMGVDPTKLNNLMAWDVSRLINVARWAQQLGWITEAEYFSICTPAAQQAQRSYKSWREFTDATFVASMIWHYKLERCEDFKVAHQRLLKEPKSPLLTLPWDTPLNI